MKLALLCLFMYTKHVWAFADEANDGVEVCTTGALRARALLQLSHRSVPSSKPTESAGDPEAQNWIGVHDDSRERGEEDHKNRSRDEEISRFSLCSEATLTGKDGKVRALRPRVEPARLIDTFAFGDPAEKEELLFRLNVMGPLVHEIRIVEGNKYFNGNPKSFLFHGLNSSLPYHDKIVYTTVDIPEGVKGYALQRFQSDYDLAQMDAAHYDKKDVLIQSDLDEIVSPPMLQVLQQCEPIDGDWDAGLDMELFYYSLNWTAGKWSGLPGPPVVTFMENVLRPSVQDVAFFRQKRVSLMQQGDMELGGSIFHYSSRLKLNNGVGGWHLSWTLNGGQGIAHKNGIHIEGGFPWFAGFPDEAALADFINNKFLTDPVGMGHNNLRQSTLKFEDLPTSVQHKDLYPNILRGVL